MNRALHFLSNYINKNIIESKIWHIKDAFLTEDSLNDVPNEAGIYIIVAKSTKFLYPKGESPVIYIGTSNHLQKRLKTHLRLYKEAEGHFKNHSAWVYSRYNYAIAFGADVYYMRITGRENEKSLERKAIEGFFDKYGALPVGNGAFTFKK